MTTAARPKRTAMYTITEASASASLTTTNVAPQITAQNPRPKSAKRRLLGILFDMDASTVFASGLAGISHKRGALLAFRTRQRDNCEEKTLQTELATGSVVPFIERVRARTFSTPAQSDCRDAQRKRNVRIGRAALEPRAVPKITIYIPNSREQRRVVWKFPCGART